MEDDGCILFYMTCFFLGYESPYSWQHMSLISLPWWNREIGSARSHFLGYVSPEEEQ
jgi:hypothetical protein